MRAAPCGSAAVTVDFPGRGSHPYHVESPLLMRWQRAQAMPPASPRAATLAASRDRMPLAIGHGEVAPRHTGPQHVEERAENLLMAEARRTPCPDGTALDQGQNRGMEKVERYRITQVATY